MLMRMEGKVALITGAGSGIGKSTAEIYAREGASVVIAELYPDRAEQVADAINKDGGTAMALPVDVTDSSAVNDMVAQTIDRFGKIDVLMNNAGLSFQQDVRYITDENWQASLDLILTAPFYGSRAVLPHMIEQGSGSIINISSVRGMTATGEEGYSAAKAGLINLTRNMAARYGKFGVRCNAICPGAVKTGLVGSVPPKPGEENGGAKMTPLGRVGQPEDVAYACLYLGSDEAAWVTGAILPVDGGLVAGPLGLLKDFAGDT
jgi:meso-butanediol dehydrogenase / (S,S)-butanediol dehydrogenase / diacetyl reductase